MGTRKIINTLSAAGPGDILTVPMPLQFTPFSFNASLSGTFSATIELWASDDDFSTHEVLGSYTAPIEKRITVDTNERKYKWQCTARASGSAIAKILY